MSATVASSSPVVRPPGRGRPPRRVVGPRMTIDANVLVEGGTIVDGTGRPGFPGSVAVVGDRLIVLPDGDRRAATDDGGVAGIRAGRTIDARGLVIAPGFIDLHSHGGLVMLAEPLHEPKVRQGVTTELIGVDGNAYAPFPSRRDLVDYVVGNSPLRIASVGWDEVEADRRAMADQRSRLREALEDGAFGLSTGLDYPPGSYATTAELVELAAVAAGLGGIYHTHVRYPLGDGFLDPYRDC